MKKYLILIFSLVSLTIISQSHDGTSTMSGGFTLGQGQTIGHPFFFDNWVYGQAIDLDGNFSEKKYFVFDIYHNRLFFKANENDMLALDENKYAGFILTGNDNKDYVFTKLEGSKFEKEKKETKFYQIAKAPSNKVIIESEKLFKDPNSSGWSSSRYNNKGGEYKLATRIYVLDKNKKYIKVNVNQSSIINVFKNKKNELITFIKKNNILINNPEDLLPIVEYYHTL